MSRSGISSIGGCSSWECCTRTSCLEKVVLPNKGAPKRVLPVDVALKEVLPKEAAEKEMPAGREPPKWIPLRKAAASKVLLGKEALKEEMLPVAAKQAMPPGGEPAKWVTPGVVALKGASQGVLFGEVTLMGVLA